MNNSNFTTFAIIFTSILFIAMGILILYWYATKRKNGIIKDMHNTFNPEPPKPEFWNPDDSIRGTFKPLGTVTGRLNHPRQQELDHIKKLQDLLQELRDQFRDVSLDDTHPWVTKIIILKSQVQLFKMVIHNLPDNITLTHYEIKNIINWIDHTKAGGITGIYQPGTVYPELQEDQEIQYLRELMDEDPILKRYIALQLENKSRLNNIHHKMEEDLGDNRF